MRKPNPVKKRRKPNPVKSKKKLAKLHIRKPAPVAKKSPGAPQKFTMEEVIDALNRHRGLQYLAARQLGCNVNTINEYKKRYPEVREVCAQRKGEIVDHAERQLFKSVRKREAWAICFTLKTQGKDRGYVERIESSGPNGGPQEHRFDVSERTARIGQLLERLRTRGVVGVPRVSGSDLAPVEAS